MENRFIHKVSKGSKYNQIYIPKEMSIFEVGDLVEVRLIKKNTKIFYSRSFKKSEFKEKLIGEIFSFLSQFKIKQVFLFGSFLIKKADYNDIDLLIVGEEEEKIYNELVDKFNLKFHIIAIPEEKFLELIEICPLTRSMLYFSVSNRKFKIPKRKINRNHINFLLMMPQDLLKIKTNSKVFYDNIRRLITIERFLKNKELNPKEIDKEIRSLVKNLYDDIKNDEDINEKEVNELRKIIRSKIEKIKRARNMVISGSLNLKQI